MAAVVRARGRGVDFAGPQVKKVVVYVEAEDDRDTECQLRLHRCEVGRIDVAIGRELEVRGVGQCRRARLRRVLPRNIRHVGKRGGTDPLHEAEVTRNRRALVLAPVYLVVDERGAEIQRGVRGRRQDRRPNIFARLVTAHRIGRRP
jgi:hypothetical protein